MKDINLFDGIKKSAPPKKSGGKSVAGGLVLLVACAVVVAGLYFWLSTQNKTVNGQIESANAQIGAAQTINGSDLQAKQSELAAIRTYNAMLGALEENIDIYPKLDAAFLGDLEGRLPAGVAVRTFGYKSGVLTLDCTAANADAPANFADALAKSQYVYTANLKASALDIEAEVAGTVQYKFTVECYLKGGTAE